MITLQYINDLAIASAKQTIKDNEIYFTPLMARVLNTEKLKKIFLLEFRNYEISVSKDTNFIRLLNRLPHFS